MKVEILEINEFKSVNKYKRMRTKDETLRDTSLTGAKRNGTVIVKEIGKETEVCRTEEYRNKFQEENMEGIKTKEISNQI